ncbi:hypothetical protein [Paraburkholderia sp.]|uniref:hypothetical protein n=1 Tax=Paraburkholderia sp. TaxID=1926495 RepID=UPI003C7BEFF2
MNWALFAFLLIIGVCHELVMRAGVKPFTWHSWAFAACLYGAYVCGCLSVVGIP